VESSLPTFACNSDTARVVGESDDSEFCEVRATSASVCNTEIVSVKAQTILRRLVIAIRVSDSSD